MNRVRHLLAIGALFLAVMPGTAAACDWPGRREDRAVIDQFAREVIGNSAAIIDAEVVVASGGGSPAQLRPLRVLKGPSLPVFFVAARSMCDIRFPRAGARVRVILNGGPETFSAALTTNGAVFPSRAGRRRFYARLDALLGVPRPRGVIGPYEQ